MGAQEGRESLSKTTLQSTAWGRRQGRKKHWVVRVSDHSPVARNIHPGQWRLLEAEFPIRGVPVSMEWAHVNATVVLSHWLGVH